MSENSNFIAKNSTAFLPIEPLCRLMKAWHRDIPADYWAEMTELMSEVKTMTIACSLSERGVICFVTTCRSTETHENDYLPNFEEGFGNGVCKEINR